MSSSSETVALGTDEGLTTGSLAFVRRAGGVVFAVQVAGAGLAYAQQVLLARLLGASHYGLYTYVFVYASFAALIAGLGLPAASVRFLPTYRLRDEASRLDGFVASALRLTYRTALCATLTAGAVALLLHALGVLRHPAPLILGGILVPALAGSILYTELARGGGRMTAAFIPPQVARPALIGAFALLLSVGGSLSSAGALASTALAAYAVLGLQHFLTRRVHPPSDWRRASSADEAQWRGVGLSLLAVGAFVIVLMQVDIVIVGAICGPRTGGFYAAASKTAALVSFVILAVNAAAAPRFAALWESGRLEELQRLVSRLAGLIFWPSLAISAGIALLAGPLLDLFGGGFSNAAPALIILLIGQLVNAGAGSVGYLLTLTGHHRQATHALAFSALAFVALAIVGTFTLGMIGAAIGSVLGFMLWNGSLGWLVVRRLGIWPSVVGRRAWRRRAIDTGRMRAGGA